MFTRCYCRNSINSCRTYLSDYSNYSDNNQINMSLSGKFLTKYPNFNLNKIKYDKYFLQKDLENLENIIKNKFNLRKEVIISAGVNGALQNIIKILFANQKGKKNLVTPFYTFDQSEYAVTSFGGYTKRVFCDGYKINLSNMVKAIDKKTKMVYLCNPNNPTGLYVKSSEIIRFANICNKLIVVDESGIEYTNNKSILDYEDIPDNIIVLRTFSKAYGLATLRIGFIVCSERFKDEYMKKITINEISGISCEIVEDVLENRECYMKSNVNLIIKERNNIITSLEKLNIKCLSSCSNIIMTETTFSKDFFKKLTIGGITVIPIKDENNKIHLRIAVQDIKTNKLFIKKMEKILKEKNCFLKGVNLYEKMSVCSRSRLGK